MNLWQLLGFRKPSPPASPPPVGVPPDPAKDTQVREMASRAHQVAQRLENQVALQQRRERRRFDDAHPSHG